MTVIIHRTDHAGGVLASLCLSKIWGQGSLQVMPLNLSVGLGCMVKAMHPFLWGAYL